MSEKIPARLSEPGAAGALPGQTKLRAGPLTLLYDHGDLRSIKLGDIEVIRRIYAAVRDRNWGTVFGALRNVRIDSGRDFFQVSYDSEHTRDDISFVWRAEITGESDGTIRFTFDGEARTTFLKTRIGFCVLHPIHECAGQPCRVDHADGTSLESSFPKLISVVQPVKDFHNLRAISHKVEPGVRAEVQFEGDIFETEDQRNWIDASFKTYCTPLSLPFPVEIKAGTRIQQSVTLKLKPSPKYEISGTREEEPISIEIDFSKTRPLSPLGLGVSSFPEGYSQRTLGLLKALNLAHLRVDLDPANPAWEKTLADAHREASSLGIPLEVALNLAASDDAPLKRLREFALSNPGSIRRWIIFTRNAPSTSKECSTLARSSLRESAPVGVGTNADFYELGQSPHLPWRTADFLCWSMNPQVHAFDELSLAETPEGITSQIESARSYFPGKPLIISPVTLKPRFNAVATGPESAPKPGELPPQVDPRQCSLFGAAWTLAALKALLESGVDSATLYETVGWRGVIERDIGAPLPDVFPSVAGGPFPLYYVLRWINELPHAQIVTSESEPKSVATLVLQDAQVIRVLVANLLPKDRKLRWLGIEGGFIRRAINQRSVHFAAAEPDEFLASEMMWPGVTIERPKQSSLAIVTRSPVRSALLSTCNSLTCVALRPHEIVCVDFPRAQE